MGYGRFVKGQKKPNQGKRGKDKVNLEAKQMIMTALSDLGGPDYLKDCGQSDNPRIKAAFLSLVGRCVTVTVAGGDVPIPIRVTFASHGVQPITSESEVES